MSAEVQAAARGEDYAVVIAAEEARKIEQARRRTACEVKTCKGRPAGIYVLPGARLLVSAWCARHGLAALRDRWQVLPLSPDTQDTLW